MAVFQKLYQTINEGYVDIYSKKKFAEDAVDYYMQQFRKLHVVEFHKDNTGLQDNISIYAYLYYLGMEEIMIDNGKYRVTVKREEILPSPEYKNVPEISVPIVNPMLRFSINDFMGEAGWRVSYPEKQENVTQKENKMIQEICTSKYLIPMKYAGENVEKDENKIIFKEGGKLNFPKIMNTENKFFTPIFTDWLEFHKTYDRNEWQGMIVTIKDAVTIGASDDIVINPHGENLILNQNSIKEIVSESEKLKI